MASGSDCRKRHASEARTARGRAGADGVSEPWAERDRQKSDESRHLLTAVTATPAPGSLRDRLTRAFVAYYYSSVEGFAEVSGPSGRGGVYWFAGGTALGQTTPFGTIILNRAAFDRLSPVARAYVLEHERGHQRRGPALAFAYWLAFACWAFVCAAALYTGVTALAGTAVAWPVSVVPALLAAQVGFLGVWWLDELHAEVAALSAVGEARFREARAELAAGTRSPRLRFLQRLVYPSPDATVRVRSLVARLSGMPGV